MRTTTYQVIGTWKSGEEIDHAPADTLNEARKEARKFLEMQAAASVKITMTVHNTTTVWERKKGAA